MDEYKETEILPLKPMPGEKKFEIELNRVPISWNLEKGCLNFFGLDSALFWTDPSLVHMLAPLAEEIGIDLFRLLISYSSSLGTDADYNSMVSTLGENFPDGFLAWGKAVSGAGWGTFELTHYDPDAQMATVEICNPWELRMQRDLPEEKRWGCPFLQGKIIGIFSHAFKTPCWSEDDCYHDPNHSRVTFRIYPSSSTIQKELKNLRYQRMQSNERSLVEKVEQKTRQLKQAQADLEEYSTSLEQQVSERTAELEALLKKLEVEKEKLKKSSLELQQREKELHELVEESPVAIFTTTPDGKLLHANKVCLGLFGFSSIEEFQKKMVNVRDLYVHPEDRDKLVDEMMRFGKVSKKEFKYKIAEKKGWLQLSVRKKRKADDSIEFQGFAQDITAEKEALEKLEESRERLQIAFGVLNAGSWSYYPQTQIAYFSPEWFTMLGYQPDEFEHTYDTWATLVHPEDLPTVVETLQRFLESRSRDIYEAEFRMLAKGGTWSWTLGRGRTFEWDENGSPYRMIGANFDVTAYKETQAALEESENLFRAIFNQTYQFTGLLDRNGRLIKANQAALSFVGKEENEVFGMPFVETPWWPDRDKNRQELKKLIEAALSGKVCRKEVVNLDEHGNEHLVDFTISPFRNDDGVITHLMAEARDVTELKLMRETMVQTEKMMSLGGLAAGMAHEINNPLSIILQGIDNIQRRTLDRLPDNLDAAREYGLSFDRLEKYLEKRNVYRSIEAVKNAANRAAKIVENMLEFSRQDETSNVLRDINHIIEKAISLAQTEYDLKKKYDFRSINIVKEFQPLPAVAVTETEIEQVVLNLLRNSAQSMREAGRENPTIQVRTRAKTGCAVIEVEDNGAGIKPEIRQRIFEPFFTTKAVGEGTGLGLSVSYYIIVNRHNGDIRVESEHGKWTRFTIELPIKKNEKVNH